VQDGAPKERSFGAFVFSGEATDGEIRFRPTRYFASLSGAAPHFWVTHPVHFATASLRPAGTAPGW